MQNALQYNRNADENPQPVRHIQEQPGAPAELLAKKTVQYMEGLRDFEAKCAEQDADEQVLLQELALLNSWILEACGQFERESNDPDEIKNARSEFRAATNPILSKSHFIDWTRTWPKGHQGDYYALECVYRNTPRSSGIGYYLDKYLLAIPLATGVRERIKTLGDLLRAELSVRREPRVLDIACGSCREIVEMVPAIAASRARFTCVDFDSEALQFAANRFSSVGLSDDCVVMRQYNAHRLFDCEIAEAEFGPQDLIYSVGYFDYLPDHFLIKMLRTLYKLLNPGGKLIIALKDADRYQARPFHWLMNWDGFFQRTKSDFDRLLHQTDIPDSALSMDSVASGSIIFYIAVTP
jgi:SAM-dependent methyltransferase